MSLLSSKLFHCPMIKLTIETRPRIMRACHVTRASRKGTKKEKRTKQKMTRNKRRQEIALDRR